MKRREILNWIAPVVVAVTLPKHAMATPVAPERCTISSFSAQFSPNTGAISRGEAVNLKIDYALQNVSSDVELTVVANTKSDRNGSLVFFEQFTDIPATGTLNLSKIPLIVPDTNDLSAEDNFSSIDVRINILGTTPSGGACGAFGSVVPLFNITVVP